LNAERWQRIQQLVEDALARPEPSRDDFVVRAGGGDVALIAEVRSLLAAPEVEELPTRWLHGFADRRPARFAAGDRVAERYVVHRLLGQGGTGEVYEAQDEWLSVPVAIKTLTHVGSTDAAVQRLKLEGMLAREVWHPNVCRVYDLARHDDGDAAVWFLVMELLRGPTLAEHLSRRGPLSPVAALPLVEQMAVGLGAAHEAGVVHRDFKPANVMLVERDGGEQAVVTDFGTARAAAGADGEGRERDSCVVVGTPAYMAPEQVRGEEAGPAADIYALGVVLYELVTGVLPFSGDTSLEVARRRLDQDPVSPRQLRPNLETDWEAVILRCLEREPGRRYARVEDVALALGGRSPAREAGDPERTALGRQTLPAERDLFVGREGELERLKRHLADSRFVTLCGAGGMGKTRLAVHYGWRSLEDWPGGVWYCDLTEARGLDGVARAVAGPLGVELVRGDAMGQLGHAIAAHGRCLVILDNFEHVAGFADRTLGRWAETARETRFVVTSRERLNLGTVQTLLEVESLPLEHGMKLFATRAHRLRPGLVLSADAEMASVRDIVELVDGMPLAIELAAARVRVMNVSEIATQMRRRFQLLTGGRGTRHTTLEAAIESSWELLAPWEKAAWAQCGVFEGGFTLEGAEDVLDLGVWPDAPWVVDVLQSLLDKSLLRAWVPRDEPGEAGTRVRFGMYESLREYARLKLDDAEAVPHGGSGRNAAGAAEERHGRSYARYGTRAEVDRLDRHGGVARRHELRREFGNFMVAYQRALAREDDATTVGTYCAAAHVLFVRGPLETAVRLGREALERIRGPEDRARLLFMLGWAELFHGPRADAEAHLGAAIAAWHDLGDRVQEGVAVGTLAVLEMNQGRMKDATAHFEYELGVARELGNRVREGIVLNNLGECLRRQGRMDEARAHFEAALVVCREVGNRRVEGMLHNNLGQVHRREGRLEEARVHLEAAVAIAREVGSRMYEGNALNTLGLVEFGRGDLDAAAARFSAALVLNRETGARLNEGLTTGNLGYLFLEQGRIEEARAQYEAALLIFRELGNPFGTCEALVALGSLHLRQDRLDDAREALRQGEEVIRAAGGQIELGMLLCTRAELEHRSGAAGAARDAIAEGEAIAGRIGAGRDSELGRKLAAVRQSLRGEI
jgi:predicted ATPase/Tfp pilus assembly protein PilF